MGATQLNGSSYTLSSNIPMIEAQPVPIFAYRISVS